MTRIKAVLAVPIFGILLMGQACPDGDAQVRSVLGTVCPSVTVAYAHFDAIRAAVSANTQNRVELVKAQADRLCASPGSATTITILAAGSEVYLAVRQALREAKASGSAVGYSKDIKGLEGLLDKARRSMQ